MTKMYVGPNQASDLRASGQWNPETMTTDKAEAVAASKAASMKPQSDAELPAPMKPQLPSNIVVERSGPQVDSPPTQAEQPGPKVEEPPRLEPDTDGMIRCLRWLRPGAERWLLTTINPVAKKGSRNATTFYLPDNATAPAKLRDANLAGLNVYFPTGAPRSTWNAASKNQPRKERDEIESCSILYFDGDFLDQDGNAIATEEGRLADINAAVATGTIPEPGLIICSGNGVQAFWRSRKPLEPEQAEGRNRWLIELLNGDAGVWDRGRLMRVGGGINWPSKKKIDKGCVPVLGRIIAVNDDAWASADQFPWVPEKKKQEEKKKTDKASGDQNEYKDDPDDPIEDPVTSIEDPRLDKVSRECKSLIQTGDFSRYKNDRSAAQFRVACYLRRVGCSGFVVRSVFENFPINDGMAEKSRRLDGEITRLIERADSFNEDPDMYAMNEKHAAVSVAGLFKVITWVPDLRYPQQRVAEFSSKASFTSIYVNPRKIVEVDKKKTELWGRGKWWLAQSNYTQHDGIDFRPGAPAIIEEKSRTLANMWCGFAIEPAEGDCPLYLGHVKANICGSDEKLYDYILDWMASGVQHPEEPGRAAISLRGAPGDGKGVFVMGYGRIFGRHFLQVTQPDHLTGKFNAHEAESVLIYADEVAFAGDPKAARIFKTKISEETKLLERKGIDAVEVDNYARYIFSTNEEHPLQIEHNDRRYLAIKVLTNSKWVSETDLQIAAEKRKAYFIPILDELRNGGRAALLDLLLKRNISKFNPEAFPRTAEGRLQKQLSAPVGDKIVMEFALDGILPGALAKRPWIAQARGENCLFETMQKRGGQRLRQCDETHLADIIKGWNFVKHPLGDRAGWRAPPLAELRAAIDRRYPGITWDPHITEWGCRASRLSEGEVENADPQIPF